MDASKAGPAVTRSRSVLKSGSVPLEKVKRDFTGEAEVNKVKKDFTGEAEVKKVEDFVSSTDADMINMKNKLEKMDDNDSEEVEIEENVNKCSRCPKTFAHKKNVARHERIHDRE